MLQLELNNRSKILILIKQPENLTLVSSFLEKYYDIVIPEKYPDDRFNYDLIIVDGISHNQFREILINEKLKVAPFFLPILLLTSKKDVDIAANFLWKTIDDLIIIPVNKTELHARVEMLLRTRKLSIELDKAHTRIHQLSQEQLNVALRSANIGIWDWDLLTNKVYYSPEWKRQIGYEVNEISDDFSEWLSRVHPDDVERCLSTINEYIKNPWPDYNLEFRFRHRNGSYLWIYTQASLIYNEEGKPVRMIGSHVDITKIKKYEERLLLYSAAITQSPTAIMVTDIDGNIEYVNPKFTEITGYTFEEVIGKTPRILKSGFTPRKVYENLWNTIKSGQTWKGDIYNKRKDGSLYWEEVLISSVKNFKGEIEHFVALFVDITERKKLLEELIKAKEKAEESDRLKSAFLANMSHEIRTPMNAILGFTELLLEPDLNVESRENFVNIIHQSVVRLLNTVNSIVEISKIEAGLVTVNLSIVDIQKCIDDLINLFIPEANKKGLSLVLDNKLPETEALILTDQSKVESIFTNLINNAIKYTNTGEIRVGSILHDQVIEFYVKDTGIGIPADQHHKIFDRFIRSDFVDKDAKQGSGLGLSIAKAYVEMLNGKIWVESETGKGSTFYFTLPRGQQKN